MSETAENRPENTKKDNHAPSKAERDAKGRFAKKNGEKKPKDDGRVKINVKKDAPNRQKSTNQGIYKFVEIPAFWGANESDFDGHNKMINNAFNHMDAMMDRAEQIFSNVDKSLLAAIKEVQKSKPDVIDIGGEVYYSQSKTAHMIAETINACGEAAAKEMAKAMQSKSDVEHGNAVKSTIEDRALAWRMAHKTASFIANLGVCVIVALAITGVVLILKSVIA